MRDLRLHVNGRDHRVSVEPVDHLLGVLRGLGLTGSKGACSEGECGSCTVLLDGASVCSCLVPAATCDGADVVTVEGIHADDLTHELIACAAVQCGFCTPGIVVAASAALERWVPAEQRPARRDIAEELSGNLCRCTGYLGILDAVERVLDSRRARRP